MKKSFLIIIGIINILLIPNNIYAKDYTFKIGPNGDYNADTMNQLLDRLNELNYEDEEDEIYDNKYIFIFEDGDYDYTKKSPFDSNYRLNTEYHFGKGTYKFNSIYSYAPKKILGKGIDKTKIVIKNGIEFDESLYSIIKDITLDMREGHSPNFGVIAEKNEIKKYGLTESIAELENVKVTGPYYEIELRYCSDDTYGIVKINNLTFDSEIEDDDVFFDFLLDTFGYEHSKKEKYIQINNSDFSKLELAFDGEDITNNPITYIQNTKLNKVYSKGGEIQIDCDSTFKDTIKRGKGDINYFYDHQHNPLKIYNIYEYNNGDQNEENGKIITEICMQKEMKINSSIDLLEIKNKYNYEIDDTWTIDPKGIIEIKGGKIIPLKIGKARIFKEIDGEVKTLIIDVTDLNKNKTILTNPETGSIELLVFVSLIIISTIVYKRIKSIKLVK